ncbi:helix-turn-helix transcriptional regulator [Mucilaginibacter sp. SMC90]|uniref:helix-turn-helix domain-containing protein n=1 Tax=Mucilaginibacter sp. SMC90 TaxID=2929803 RepID=UPI001FB1FD41|nr:helix-turn-helix transcriptional regulator [Mucilaginibacter sp. SMC90]UOE47910.1 helix-turn-helix transcriptional regulator [Mucilaginibacter sp. SMC90]
MGTLGQSIRLLRRQNGWSQGDVAKRLDISIPAFSKIETGATDINLSRLEQISAVFGLSTVQLLSIGETRRDTVPDALAGIHQKLNERESEVIFLQKKVIALFEELRLSKHSA